MHKIERVVAAALAGVVVPAATAQDAVQWRVEDGGNGHWYRWLPWGSVSSFSDTAELAASINAHLVTLTSENEEAFVRELRPAGGCGTAEQIEAVIGLVQDPASEPLGGWRWITDEALAYTNWRVGEPNDAGSGEDVGMLNAGFGWNDAGSTGYGCGHSAILEWSADCNNDGIVDYGQILDGTFADENGNGVPDCCELDCPGDLNGDDAVGPPDLGILLAVWGTDGGKIGSADLNGDGTVNAADLGILIGAWGECSGCN